MAGKPLEATVLAALGYRVLSMSPALIGPVKEALISTDIKELGRYIEYLTKFSESSLRHRLQNSPRERCSNSGEPLLPDACLRRTPIHQPAHRYMIPRRPHKRRVGNGDT